MVVVGMLVSTAVLVAGVRVAAASGTVVVVLGVSSSTSLGLLNVNGTFVDNPQGIAICSLVHIP